MKTIACAILWILLSLAPRIGCGGEQGNQIEARAYTFRVGNVTRIVIVPAPVGALCDSFAVHAKDASKLRHAGSAEKDAESNMRTEQDQNGSQTKAESSFASAVARRMISAAVIFAYVAPEHLPAEGVHFNGLYFCVTGGYANFFKQKGMEM